MQIKRSPNAFLIDTIHRSPRAPNYLLLRDHKINADVLWIWRHLLNHLKRIRQRDLRFIDELQKAVIITLAISDSISSAVHPDYRDDDYIDNV